jgi:hypothetical protein
MADYSTIEDAEKAARQLLDNRIGLFREIAEAAAELEPLQLAALEGEQRLLQAWAAALSGGWSLEELRGLGYREPDKAVAGKKAKPKAKAVPAQAAPVVVPPKPGPPPPVPEASEEAIEEEAEAEAK